MYKDDERVINKFYKLKNEENINLCFNEFNYNVICWNGC